MFNHSNFKIRNILMSILTLQALSMGFEDRVLFQNINLGLEAGDRFALIGANGCGKTTLLRLITGELEPESGQVVLAKHVKIGYAAQEALAGQAATSRCTDPSIYDEALAVFEPLMSLERELEQVTATLRHDHSEALLHRQSELQDAFERGSGLTFRARTRSALVGLGFPEHEHGRPASQLSGGQQAKLRLGRLLLSGADLLLLDEPTNHLDLRALAWLEDYLRDYPGAVVIVSHDRRFLDNTATKTGELRRGRLVVYRGGYSDALRQRAAQAELDRRHYDNQMAEIRRVEGIIEQQKRFNQARNYITIASKQKQLDRLRAELVVPESKLRELQFRFPPVPETGNEVLRLRGLSKRFGEKTLFENVSGLIEKGDRAFILGPNGCGKTTLLRILRRQIKAEEGWFAWGANVCPGSYDQQLSDIRSAKTVLDEVWDTFRTLTQTEVRSMLGLFLFSGEGVFKPVETLSGGERARIALIKLMLSGANVLLLDEPTNHLDIPSREALEAALPQFGGTIVAVSHDRYFISKLATKIFVLREDGLELCGNSYEEYLSKISIDSKAKPESPTEKEQKPANEYQQKKINAAEARRQRAALARCEAEIERLEREIDTLHARLALPEYAADYEKILALTEELQAREGELDKVMAEWETLI